MRWVRYFITSSIALLIGVGILLPAATFAAPMIGRQLLAVRGESMEPAIPLGSLVLVSERATDDLRVGDIVTWRAENGVYVTHRLIRIVEQDGGVFVQTQGDANDDPDPSAVPVTAVVGVVDGWLPVAGYLTTMLGTPTGLISWLCFGLALLAADGYLTDISRPQPAPTAPERRVSRKRAPRPAKAAPALEAAQPRKAAPTRKAAQPRKAAPVLVAAPALKATPTRKAAQPRRAAPAQKAAQARSGS